MCETQLSHIQLGALSRIEAYRVRRALLFNAIHLVTTVLFVACTLFKLATSEALFTVTLINVYACVLGIMLFVIELRDVDPAIEYFLFLYTVKGRGLLFIFLGCLIIDARPFPLFTGMWLLAVGLAMFLISFTRHVPRLTDLRANLHLWRDLQAKRRTEEINQQDPRSLAEE